MEPRKCKLSTCNNHFIPHLTNVKKGHGKFCSPKCWAKFRHLESLLIKECKVCGAVFRGKKKRITCSKTCGTKWMIMSRKKRTTYGKKTIIGSLSEHESKIIRLLREVPEITAKVLEIIKARKTMHNVYGRFLKERDSNANGY